MTYSSVRKHFGGIFDLESKQQRLSEIKDALAQPDVELRELASGFSLQIKPAFSPWVMRLFEEKPARYTRVLLETLAIIAYRQPVTRGEIESIRGVAVSTQTIKTLHEREWVRVVGHRDVPGRPAIYATTKDFLDYFNLKNLEELPTLTPRPLAGEGRGE